MSRLILPPRVGELSQPSFELVPKFSGVERLNPLLTINGVTEAPKLRVTGSDATVASWPAWGYGETLTAIGAGANPLVNNGSPWGGSRDDSVKFVNGGNRYAPGNNTLLNITTEDIVLELALWPMATSIAMAKRLNHTGQGYVLYTNAGNQLIFYIVAGVSTVGIGTNALTESYVHALAFLDRSGFGMWFVNGVAQPVVNISGVAASLTVADPFCLGGYYDGYGAELVTVAYMAMWLRNNWLNTHDQAALALARFNALSGIRPTTAWGSSVPLTQSRASVAVSRRDDLNRVFSCGDNLLRPGTWTTPSGKTLRGLHIEPERTNRCLRSNELATAPWAVSGAPTVTNNTTDVLDPRGTNTASKVAGLGAYGVTDVYQDVTTLGVSVNFGVGFWLYKSTATGTLRVQNTGGAPLGQWDIGLSAVPAATWVRIDRGSPYISVLSEFVSTAGQLGTVAFCASAGGPLTVYLWGVQAQTGSSLHATSTIETAGSAVVRLGDVLAYAAPANLTQGIGGFKMRFACQNAAGLAPGDAYLLNLYVGAADKIIVRIRGNGYVQVDSSKTAGDSGLALITGITWHDGEEHEFSLSWQTDRLVIWNGDTQTWEDTSVDPPDTLISINVGVYATTAQPNVLLTYLAVYPRAPLSPKMLGGTR